jgi:hypothetical protein
MTEAPRPHMADDQGVTRLAMIAFLRGDDGPWDGVASSRARWVRYRAHTIDRQQTPDGNLFQMTYANHLGDRLAESFTLRTSPLVVLRDLDDLLDVVFEQWPHVDDTEPRTWTPSIDDHLTLDDALRSLDAFPAPDGEAYSLVRGQDVFDLLVHRGVLRDETAAQIIEREQHERDDDAEGKAIARAAEPDVQDDER